MKSWEINIHQPYSCNLVDQLNHDAKSFDFQSLVVTNGYSCKVFVLLRANKPLNFLRGRQEGRLSGIEILKAISGDIEIHFSFYRIGAQL